MGSYSSYDIVNRVSPGTLCRAIFKCVKRQDDTYISRYLCDTGIVEKRENLAFFNYGRNALYLLFQRKFAGKEIIFPAFICPTVILAAVKAGVKPNLIDVNLEDFNLDINSIPEEELARTDALFINHTFGVPADMDEILKRHEKGVEFAFILEGFDRYPLIVDKDDNVLSFPPIINSALTTVTHNTKNIFIDVTGTDLNLVTNMLNLVATGMAETGASLYSIIVRYPDKEMTLPDLKPRRKNLNVTYANRILGLELPPNRIKESFEKMRFGTELKGNDVVVDVPAYRSDILHPIDLVEDLAIGYGYEKFKHTLPDILTFGKKRNLTEFCTRMRDVMLGLGFQEVDTLALGKAFSQDETRLVNPLSEEHSSLRASLITSLLDVLKTNKRHELPQKIFQIGYIIEGSSASMNLGALIIHSKTSFTEIKSLVESVIRPADLKFKAQKHPYFINGRCASISDEDENLGVFGELHPRIITEHELGYPMTAFELNITKLEQKVQ